MVSKDLFTGSELHNVLLMTMEMHVHQLIIISMAAFVTVGENRGAATDSINNKTDKSIYYSHIF